MKIVSPLVVFAVVVVVAGCSTKNKKSARGGAPDRIDAIAGVEEPQPSKLKAAPGRPQPRPSTPPSSGGGYAVSSTPLRNPVINIPRVSGNSQVSISQGKVSGNYLAMTFDDGPHPRNTPRLLDMLAQRNIKATFYVVGTNARAYPAIMRRIVAEGHEIGNHTVNHGNLSKMSNDKIRSELQGAADGIIAATGIPPRTVRPPYGAITSSQKQWIFDEFGYTTVLWSVDPRDWQRPGVSVVSRRLVDGARSGGILLAHDIHAPTIDAMPSTFDELLRRGFKFVTVSQLMAIQSAESMGPPRVSANAVPLPEIDPAPTTGPVPFGPPVPGQ